MRGHRICKRCKYLGVPYPGTYNSEVWHCKGHIVVRRPNEFDGVPQKYDTRIPAFGSPKAPGCGCGTCAFATARSSKLGLIDKRSADAYLLHGEDFLESESET